MISLPKLLINHGMIHLDEGVEGIRLVKQDDVSQLYEIETRSFPDPWSETLFNATLSALNTYCQVMTLKSREGMWAVEHIIGYIIYQCFLDEGHVLNFAIHPDYRGRGHGKKLLREILDEMRGRGCQSIFLELRKGNMVARKLYESVGFEVCGERKRYYENHDDAIVMVKRHVT